MPENQEPAKQIVPLLKSAGLKPAFFRIGPVTLGSSLGKVRPPWFGQPGQSRAITDRCSRSWAATSITTKRFLGLLNNDGLAS